MPSYIWAFYLLFGRYEACSLALLHNKHLCAAFQTKCQHFYRKKNVKMRLYTLWGGGGGGGGRGGGRVVLLLGCFDCYSNVTMMLQGLYQRYWANINVKLVRQKYDYAIATFHSLGFVILFRSFYDVTW